MYVFPSNELRGRQNIPARRQEPFKQPYSAGEPGQQAVAQTWTPGGQFLVSAAASQYAGMRVCVSSSVPQATLTTAYHPRCAIVTVLVANNNKSKHEHTLTRSKSGERHDGSNESSDTHLETRYPT